MLNKVSTDIVTKIANNIAFDINIIYIIYISIIAVLNFSGWSGVWIRQKYERISPTKVGIEARLSLVMHTFLF